MFLKVGLVCQHTEPGHANKLPPCTRTTRTTPRITLAETRSSDRSRAALLGLWCVHCGCLTASTTTQVAWCYSCILRFGCAHCDLADASTWVLF